MKKKVVVLGSTGSLGVQMLEVLQKHRQHFQIIGLSGNKNEKLLKRQGKKFKVKTLVLASGIASPPEIFRPAGINKSEKAPAGLEPFPARNKKAQNLHQILLGKKTLLQLAQMRKADIIVNLLSGTAGINPTIAALKAGKVVLLGNKESIVAEGNTIMKTARGCFSTQSTAGFSIKAHCQLPPHNLIPIDSEHNAICEILKKHPDSKIDRIILPCSGGPFLGKSKNDLSKVTSTQALAHPKWKMGAKISVESATLINKGLEVIEAHYLFNLPIDKIQVKIHPECKIHGVVKFKPGSKGEEPLTVAYFAAPYMREHLENALLRGLESIYIKAQISPSHKKAEQLMEKKSKLTPPPPKFPTRQIRPLKKNEFIFSDPDHSTFPGIKIVLNHFKKSISLAERLRRLAEKHTLLKTGQSRPRKQPKPLPGANLTMKAFLRKEERIIQQFLNGKISFPAIFAHLK